MGSIWQGRYKARKRYECGNCEHYIEKGEMYWRAFGSTDDRFKNPPPFVLRLCKRCDRVLKAKIVYEAELKGA